MTATVQLDPCTEVSVSVANGYMPALRLEGTTVWLSDYRDKVAGVADLIARMFETLASAPDLTNSERQAVRDRMTQAVEDVTPIVSLPPPADATPDELAYWEREHLHMDLDSERQALLDTEDRVICFTKVPGGYCVLDKGHTQRCANERTYGVPA